MTSFLFDENLPRMFRFSPVLPVIHATDIGESLSDRCLWDYARQKEMVIVTKDADFRNMILVDNPPPWIVQLQIGNMSRNEFHSFLSANWSKVESLLPHNKLIIVFKDHIESVS